MTKSLIDVLWLELKELFYKEHSNMSEKELDVSWMEYQVTVIKKCDEEK